MDISPTFLQKAASVLGDTYGGLSGPDIINRFCIYGEKWSVSPPFSKYPYGVRSKSSVFRENLESFSSSQQFFIISELCGLPAKEKQTAARKQLKLELYSKFGDLRPEAITDELELPLIKETRHWLQKYPDSLRLFDQAKLKYDQAVFERNTLDDLRLSLESLLQQVLGNKKSLENQVHDLTVFLKNKKTSPEIRNTFPRLVDYYAKYQNAHSKHKDNPVREELEFIFELTASLMKYVVRISQ